MALLIRLVAFRLLVLPHLLLSSSALVPALPTTAAAAAAAAEDYSAVIAERRFPNQPSPAPSQASPISPIAGQLAPLGAVVGFHCEDPAAHYGHFDLSDCRKAREEMHSDPNWPDKKRYWKSVDAAPFRTYGSRGGSCEVTLRAPAGRLVGTFTLADVEAGLVTVAGHCAEKGRGGYEYYRTVNAAGQRIFNVRDGWTMHFWAPVMGNGTEGESSS
ncbi:MAG: hypothetical protein Q9214_002121 [Letrouitia sp. 1 TL-2023]